MGEVLALVVPWVVSTGLLFLLVRSDESRLSPFERARAWPAASRTLAIVYFGVLSLPVHFGRTRRSLAGVAQGLAWAVAIAALDAGIGFGIDELTKCFASR